MSDFSDFSFCDEKPEGHDRRRYSLLLIPCSALCAQHHRFSPGQYGFAKVVLIIEEAPHRDT